MDKIELAERLLDGGTLTPDEEMECLREARILLMMVAVSIKRVNNDEDTLHRQTLALRQGIWKVLNALDERKRNGNRQYSADQADERRMEKR